jgi:hypothetical protein
MTYDAHSMAIPTMPFIKVKTNCVYIQPSEDTLYAIKKESILGYHVSGTYDTYLRIYTTMSNLEIRVTYSKSEGEQFRKDAEVLHSVLSPPVQTTGDLLTMTEAIPNPVPKP